MKKVLALTLAACLCLVAVACNQAETKPAVENASIQEAFVGVLGEESVNQTNESGGVDHLVYTSPIQNDFLFIESRLVDHVGEDAFKEWTHEEAAKGTYEYTVNVLGYINRFSITKEQFTKACNVVPDLPLYTDEQINYLYNSDVEKVLKHVKNAGAVYSNGKLYSAEWMNCSSVDDYITENLDIKEMKNAMADTQSAIDAFGTNQAGTALSYKDKVSEYEQSAK